MYDIKLGAILRSVVLFVSFTLICGGNAGAETLSYLGPSGGGGGSYYSSTKSSGLRLVEIRIRSGALIDAIQTVHVNAIGQEVVSDRFGGGGGSIDVFKLAPGEFVTRISGKYGVFVDSLLIQTNTGRAKGWGGTGGAVNYTYSAPPGTSIHGFWGRSGELVDSIGVILKVPK